LNNAEEPENRFIIADIAENCYFIKSEKAPYLKDKVKKYADSLHFEVQKDIQ
jgi:tryptophanase